MVKEPTGPVTTRKLLSEYSISSQLFPYCFTPGHRLVIQPLSEPTWENTRFSPDMKIQLVQVIVAVDYSTTAEASRLAADFYPIRKNWITRTSSYWRPLAFLPLTVVQQPTASVTWLIEFNFVSGKNLVFSSSWLSSLSQSPSLRQWLNNRLCQ